MSSPQEYLLSSYNVLTIQQPADIFYNSKSCTAADVPQDDVVTKDSFQEFKGTYKSEYTAQTLQTTYTNSFGVEFEYAKVSGDAQTTYTSSKYTKTTSFNASYYCTVSCGVTSLRNQDSADILGALKPDLVSELNGIASSAQAKDFTDRWGTHLITGVKLGGSLFIAIQADTNTETDKTAVDASVSASYKNAGSSINATASAAKSVTTTSTTVTVEQTTSTVGGSATAGFSIDCSDPSSFETWADSCSTQTVQALNSSVTFFSLLPQGSAARSTLERYVQLAMLAESLNHPAYLNATATLQPYKTFSVSVAPNEAGERILCGGAALSEHSNSFLMGSYPNQNSDGDISSWSAASHDSGEAATGTLTAYAFAVYDPHRLLTVTVKPGFSHSTASGGDEVGATVQGLLVGGGTKSTAEGSSSIKLVYASYPSPAPGNSYYTEWISRSCDYINKASDTTLTSYAIGLILPDGLSVSSTFTPNQTQPAEFGDSIAVLPKSQFVCGGGFCLTFVDNAQNFPTASYPADLNSWRVTNVDGNGRHAKASTTAYAITLNAEVPV